MKRMICFMFVLPILVMPCFATAESLAEAAEIGAVSDLAPEGASDIEYSEDISFTEGLSGIFDKIKNGIGDIFTSGLRCVVMVIAVSFLSASVSSMSLSLRSDS